MKQLVFALFVTMMVFVVLVQIASAQSPTPAVPTTVALTPTAPLTQTVSPETSATSSPNSTTSSPAVPWVLIIGGGEIIVLAGLFVFLNRSQSKR